MAPREQFDRELKELRANVINLGTLVDNQLELALRALETLDTDLAKQVIEIDQRVNAARFAIESDCFKLIVTQQPAARDLRLIFAAINIIVDLERVGDKAKDIADTIPHIMRSPNRPRPPELMRMANLVKSMLEQCMLAFADDDIGLARQVASRDKELVALFAEILNRTIEDFAKAKKEKKVTAAFGVLRAAQHLERIGDLAINVTERIIYVATGNLKEMKTHLHDTID
jgi:phosphate transport system protein